MLRTVKGQSHLHQLELGGVFYIGEDVSERGRGDRQKKIHKLWNIKKRDGGRDRAGRRDGDGE